MSCTWWETPSPASAATTWSIPRGTRHCRRWQPSGNGCLQPALRVDSCATAAPSAVGSGWQWHKENGPQPEAVVRFHLWSAWRDSNSRPLAPHASALPGCATRRRIQLYTAFALNRKQRTNLQKLAHGLRLQRNAGRGIATERRGSRRRHHDTGLQRGNHGRPRGFAQAVARTVDGEALFVQQLADAGSSALHGAGSTGGCRAASWGAAA